MKQGSLRYYVMSVRGHKKEVEGKTLGEFRVESYSIYRARIWPTALRQLPWWPLSFAVVPPEIVLCPRPKVAVVAIPVCRSALPMPDANCSPNLCVHGDAYQISHRRAFQYTRISSKSL